MSKKTLLAATAVLTTSYLYYQQHRLSTLYPTYPIPSSLDPVNRSDNPFTTPNWMKSDAGDLWYFRTPRKVLRDDKAQSTTTHTREELDSWTKAFWGSWPLKVEGRIIGLLTRFGLGVVTPHEGTKSEYDERGRWKGTEVGTRLVGGGFTVDAVDHSPEAPRHICRWGSLTHSPTSSLFIRGGYHTLAILSPSTLPAASLPASAQASDDDILLVFASHAVYKRPVPPRINAQGEEEYVSALDYIPDSTWRDRLLGRFHELYSRILIDLAVGRMGLSPG
ncbi:hypothetical protein IAR55_006445 [Kwoniella newhampshirensis]|uniref:Uncharacterized protein n=1 Tax=Kwoniella newhampshirensis TaxID=1651941 RepID=A0AAW0YEN7_9TREE